MTGGGGEKKHDKRRNENSDKLFHGNIFKFSFVLLMEILVTNF